jgi:uncharacterized DUF497 family protein
MRVRLIWDLDDEINGNVQHVADHGLSKEAVEYVIAQVPASRIAISRTTGHPCVFGYTPDGTYIIVIFERADEDSIRVRSAFEVPQPKANR